MIIQFSVANFRSIASTQTLNFRATSLKSDNNEVDQHNIVEVGNNRMLKTVGIYGANASGKSNIILALIFFRDMVSRSLTDEELSKRGMSPFRLSIEDQNHSGFFEIVLLLDEKKFRYGFSLTSEGDIAAEWLNGPAEKNETYYFTRKEDKLDINPLWFQEADDLPKEKVRSNALFLSFCSAYDGLISSLIKEFISTKVLGDNYGKGNGVRSIFNNRFNTWTNLLIESGQKEVIMTWMKDAGIQISDVIMQKVSVGSEFASTIISVQKTVYAKDSDRKITAMMNLSTDESEGTRKYYSYIGIFHKLFTEGGIFVSDEIDSNFHPALLKKIMCHFNNPEVNKAGAQLIFTSHDTNLMKPELMRRDQFYFVEKSLQEESILYSLSDLKGVRNNADFASQYLAGLYGALPILGNYLEESSN